MKLDSGHVFWIEKSNKHHSKGILLTEVVSLLSQSFEYLTSIPRCLRWWYSYFSLFIQESNLFLMLKVLVKMVQWYFFKILPLLSHQYCTHLLVVVKIIATGFEDFHACKLRNKSQLRISSHSIPLWNLCITYFKFDQKILWCIKSILTHHWISSGYIDYFPYIFENVSCYRVQFPQK